MFSIFVDLDGVLNDFVSSALRVHGARLPMAEVTWNFQETIGFSGEREPLFWNAFGREFWASTEPLIDGMTFFNALKMTVDPLRIGILSSPVETDGCLEGKRDWIRKHLPEFKRRFLLGSAKDLAAAPNILLVDDNDTNVQKFAAAGGRTVLVPRPWNARRDECLNDGAFDPSKLLAEVLAEVKCMTAPNTRPETQKAEPMTPPIIERRRVYGFPGGHTVEIVDVVRHEVSYGAHEVETADGQLYRVNPEQGWYVRTVPHT